MFGPQTVDSEGPQRRHNGNPDKCSAGVGNLLLLLLLLLETASVSDSTALPPNPSDSRKIFLVPSQPPNRVHMGPSSPDKLKLPHPRADLIAISNVYESKLLSI